MKHINILLLALMGLLIWGLFFKTDPTIEQIKEYWESSDFKTDTLIMEVDYTKLPIPQFKYKVPPVIVRNYYQKDSTIINNIHLVSNDSLLTVIDSLKMKITEISVDFIKLYPDASKLIYAEFTSDSITLDLLQTSGNIQGLTIGTNYNRFTYQYRDGAFRAEPVEYKRPNKFESATYGFVGYDILARAPLIGADHSIHWRKWRLQANIAGSIETTPQWILIGNLGYKIK